MKFIASLATLIASLCGGCHGHASHEVVIEGTYGKGTPTAYEVRTCQANLANEMIYYPAGWSADKSDMWICEGK